MSASNLRFRSPHDNFKDRLLPPFHLFEIHDQPWRPAVIRDGLTDYLAYQERNIRIFKPVLPMIVEAAKLLSLIQVIDLFSGGGGPWIDWLPNGAVQPIRSVVLTDKFPNYVAANRHYPAGLLLEKQCGRYRGSKPVTRVSHSIYCFPSLQDACANGQTLGIFEFTQRSIMGLLLMIGTIIPVWIAMVQIRPFKLSRNPPN